MNFTVNGEILDQVTNFSYFEPVIINVGRIETEIKKTIGMAKKYI